MPPLSHRASQWLLALLIVAGGTACHAAGHASADNPTTSTVAVRPTSKPKGPFVYPIIGELREVVGAIPGDGTLASGEVVVSTPRGERVNTASTVSAGRFFVQLREGTYVVSATTTSGAICGPVTLRVSSTSPNFARLTCRKPSASP